MIIIFSVILIVDHDIKIVKLWALFSLFKLFRYLIFYFNFDWKQIKTHIIKPCLKYFYDLSQQILILFIIFSALGMTLFGGNINSFTIDAYNDDMDA